jgi:hypothetical protein
MPGATSRETAITSDRRASDSPLNGSAGPEDQHGPTRGMSLEMIRNWVPPDESARNQGVRSTIDGAKSWLRKRPQGREAAGFLSAPRGSSGDSRTRRGSSGTARLARSSAARRLGSAASRARRAASSQSARSLTRT